MSRTKMPPVEREDKRDIAPSLKMRAKPNWETIDPLAETTVDKLKIDPALIPEGMSAQWVTDSIYGQPQAQRRAGFEKGGWTPVHQSDFDGQFDGMFMPRGMDGEIKMEGLVLMMRPKEITDAAQRRDKRAAREQVMIKEAALTGGDIGASLDSQHPNALKFNHINKTRERLVIPEE